MSDSADVHRDARIPYPDLTAPNKPLSSVLDQIQRKRPFVPNLYRMLLWSPPLAEAWARLSDEVRFQSGLDDRTRELAILQVSSVTGCDYEWHHHLRRGLEVGFRQEELDAVRRWPADGGWSPAERALLAFTAAVAQQEPPADSDVVELRNLVGERGLVELVALVALYVANATVILALQVGIEREASTRR